MNRNTFAIVSASCLLLSNHHHSVVYGQENPPCYWCAGNPDAKLLHPERMMNVTEFAVPGGVTELSCQDLYDIGVSGYIPADTCSYLTVSKFQDQTNCGKVTLQFDFISII
jgi:hypothetical protein